MSGSTARTARDSYGDSRTAYKQLCEQETLDCVICCTPWAYHTPVCVAAMKNNKNAVSEVPIVIKLEEAWEIVETHEKTKKWATMGLEGFGNLPRAFAGGDDGPPTVVEDLRVAGDRLVDEFLLVRGRRRNHGGYRMRRRQASRQKMRPGSPVARSP